MSASPIQALAAEARRAHHHLVVAEIGGFQDHLDAVRQRQVGQAERLVLRFGDDAAGFRGLRHQLRAERLFLVRRHLGLLGRGERRQQCVALAAVAIPAGCRAGINHQLAGVGGNRAARVGVHFVERNPGQHLLHVAVFGVDAGDRFLLQEVAHVFGDVGAGIGFLALVVDALVTAQHVLLGAIEFGLPEAVAACAFVLAHQRLDRLGCAAGTDHGAGVEGLVEGREFPEGAAAAQERRLGCCDSSCRRAPSMPPNSPSTSCSR
jgi:hypothetical protein